DGNIADLRPLQGAGVDRIAGRTQRLPDLLRHQPRLSLQFRYYSRGRQPAARSIVTTGASAHVLEPDLLVQTDRNHDDRDGSGTHLDLVGGRGWICHG